MSAFVGRRLTPDSPQAPERPALGWRVVCLSDTHGCHASVDVPAGDILVHGGDFTRYGREIDAVAFNEWLGTLPHAYKFVVSGNHEANANWASRTQSILTNAIFLHNATHELVAEGSKDDGMPQASEAGAAAAPTATPRGPLRIHGTGWFWPMKTSNPYYEAVRGRVDILVCHSPCAGLVDGGSGCAELGKLARRLAPRLVVSGHIHGAHGFVESGGTTFVNAANARRGHGDMGWPAVVVDL